MCHSLVTCSVFIVWFSTSSAAYFICWLRQFLTQKVNWRKTTKNKRGTNKNTPIEFHERGIFNIILISMHQRNDESRSKTKLSHKQEFWIGWCLTSIPLTFLNAIESPNTDQIVKSVTVSNICLQHLFDLTNYLLGYYSYVWIFRYWGYFELKNLNDG